MTSVRVLLPDPSAHVEHWRRQLGLIIQQASETYRALQIQAAEPDIGSATRTRLQSLARPRSPIRPTTSRWFSGPCSGDPLPPREGVGLPRG